MPSRSKRRLKQPENDDPNNLHDGIELKEEKPIDRHKRARARVDLKLMKSSGQTEDERRALRLELRNIQKRLVGSEGDDIENVETGAFERVRRENNALFEKVRYTREAVLDGENVDLMTGRASKQVEKLVAISRYDAVRLAHKLLSKCSLNSGRTLDWYVLGREAGSCFNSVPSRICFYHGPIGIDYEPKVRKKAQRRSKQSMEDVEEETPEELHQKKKSGDDADNNKLSAVDKHMEVMKKTLKKKSQHVFEKRLNKFKEMEEGSDKKKTYEKYLRQNGKETCAIQFLFNPKSFTQTVENIFHFSFLVKHGAASISVKKSQNENDEYPFQSPVIQPKRLGDKNQSKQAIVAINMQDWRSLCENFEVEEGDIPHRRVPKV